MKIVVNPIRALGIRAALGKFHRLIPAGAAIAVSCLGCLTLGVRLSEAQEVLPSAFEGIWSTTVTAITHPDWTIDDLFACNCTRETYEYLDQLLHDPANDHLSAADIQTLKEQYSHKKDYNEKMTFSAASFKLRSYFGCENLLPSS